MIGFVNIIKIIVWFVLVPFVLGLLFENVFRGSKKPLENIKTDREGLNSAFIMACFPIGYGIMLSVFQIVSIPIVYKRLPFHVVKNAWMILIILLVLLTLAIKRRTIVNLFGNIRIESVIDKKTFDLTKLLFMAAILVIIFQTWLLVFNMHTDTDDVRFISEALEAYEDDSMLKYHPIQGIPLENPEGEMLKDMSSTYPFFIAVMSKMIGVVPAVTAHVVFPLFLIPLCYIVAYLIGSYFFKEKKYELSIFMLLLSIIVLFSFESIYSFGYTLLTIVWQGRSIVATIMLPFLWLVLMKGCTEEAGYAQYMLELILYVACANLSGMGITSAILLGGAYAVNGVLLKRNIKELALHIAVMIPNMMFFVYYYFLCSRFLGK